MSMEFINAEDGPRDLVPIIHQSARPARQGHEGEVTYLRLWQRFMSTPGAVEEVYRECYLGRDFDQRAATAGASLICWLATNVGSSFLHDAKVLSERLGTIAAEDAYLMSWARLNRRKSYSCNGVRFIEHLLTRGELRSTANGVNWAAVAEADINLDDQDAIECVVMWLSTQRGLNFIKACEVATRGEDSILKLLLDTGAGHEG